MAATSVKRPTTPLRRISRGSLNALSHSRGPSSSTPLSFLDRALADLVDETSVLQANLEQVEAIQDALGTFNESFAMYMYGIKMNAFCVDWPEMPVDEHFERAQQRISQQAEQFAAQQHLQSTFHHASHPHPHDLSIYTSAASIPNPADQTYVTQDDESIYPEPPPVNVPAPTAQPLKSALKKPKPSATTATTTTTTTTAKAGAATAKPRMTLAQKKKREVSSNVPTSLTGQPHSHSHSLTNPPLASRLTAAGLL